MRYQSNPRLYSTNKKNKTKKKRLKVKPLLLLIVIIAILIFVIYRMFFFVPKYTVKTETWHYTAPVKARVFAQSTPLIATKDGILHLEAEDESLVNEGHGILSIVDSEQEEVIRNRMSEIQEEISFFNIVIDENGNELVEEPINNPVSELRNAIRHYGIYQRENNFRAVEETYIRIQTLQTEYFEYVKRVDNDQNRFNSLKSELANLQKEYEDCSVSVQSPATGFILFEYDNLTNKLDYSDISDAYYELMNEDIVSVAINDGDSISTGDIIGKIVKSGSYYLASIIPDNLREGLKLADEIILQQDDYYFEGELLTDNLDDEVFIWNITSDLVSFAREIDIIIKTEELEGFYVPKTAILFEEDSAFIYVYDGRYPVKTTVEILKEEGTQYFISGLRHNNEIVEDIEQFRR
jgi:uncharacterized protein YaaR (DUF327 family)